MNTPPPRYDLGEYQIVLIAFTELRGRGVVVSSQDLEVLKSWAEDQLPPKLIIKVFESIALENQENNKSFSTSLKALDRTVRRAVRDLMDY
jgi:RNase adaptor protein for sRNA GlmZ degradation